MPPYKRWVPRMIGPAILGYFLFTVDLGKIVLNLRSLRWGPLLLSLALYPLFVAFKAWRWNLLVRSLRMRPPGLRYSFLLYMIGMFAAGATPGQSGDFIKAWYLRQRGEPLGPALFSVLLDRLFDFLLMSWLSLIGVVAFLHLFPPHLRRPVQAIAAGFAVAMVLLILVLVARRPRHWLIEAARKLAPGRTHAALERWKSQLAGLTFQPRLVGSLLLASVCSATSGLVRLWLLFEALSIVIPVTAFVASMALVAILQAVPISISGVGVRDAVLIGVLGGFGYGPEAALALSALYLLLNLENVALGFLVSLRHPLAWRRPAGPVEVGGR